MAKPLRQPPPTSSVAHLFDMEAAARAVATPAVAPRPASQEPAGTPKIATELVARSPEHAAVNLGEQPNVKREFVLTPSTDQAFTRLVDLYRRSTGTRLTSSHVARAVMKGIAHCMDTLEREARRMGPQRLPSNARDQALERERFEARIADAFVAGVRSAAAFDSD